MHLCGRPMIGTAGQDQQPHSGGDARRQIVFYFHKDVLAFSMLQSTLQNERFIQQ